LFPKDLAEHNAGDAFGAIFFLLVDMAGANFSTPSGEGNPATGLVDGYDVTYDKRTTSYASCDQRVGSTDFMCSCNHERQLNKTASCTLTEVGAVNLKLYYKNIKIESEAGTARAAAAGPGCSWYDDDRCQINLGKKLSNTTLSYFRWFSFPRCVQNSKWRITASIKTVHAFCLIDSLGVKLAPTCKASCGQAIPSAGHYSLRYFNCFFEAVLGPDWNTGTSGSTGVAAAALGSAFDAAFAACPAAVQANGEAGGAFT
jgi:hypothetical protein